MYKGIALFFLLFVWATALFAQKQIILRSSQSLTGSRIRNAVNVQRPVFQQDNATLTCDSAIFYQDRNVFDAFGNVHINQADTVNIFSDRLTYDGNAKRAHLESNVRMVQGQTILTTNVLDYDMLPRIGTYVNGGKIVGKDVTITSRNGYYFANSTDSYFRYNVHVTTPNTVITGDTLRFNSTSRWAYFYGPTNIRGKDDNLYTENGAYNTQTDQAFFGKRNLYTQGSRSLKGDSLYYDGRQGYGRAVGNIFFRDTVDKTLLRGQLGQYWKGTQRTMVTKNAYIGLGTADTVHLGRRVVPDTLWMGADTLETQMAKTTGLRLLPRITVVTESALGTQAAPNNKTQFTTAATAPPTAKAGQPATATAPATTNSTATAATAASPNAPPVATGAAMPNKITEPPPAKQTVKPGAKTPARTPTRTGLAPVMPKVFTPANTAYNLPDIAGTPAEAESLKPALYDRRNKTDLRDTAKVNAANAAKTQLKPGVADSAVKAAAAKPILPRVLPPPLTPEQRAAEEAILQKKYALENNPFGLNSNKTAITPYINTAAAQQSNTKITTRAIADTVRTVITDSAAGNILPARNPKTASRADSVAKKTDPNAIRPIIDDKGRAIIAETQMRLAGRLPAMQGSTAPSANAAENSRVILAYRSVRVFKHNAQAVADSVFYAAADSTLRCYRKPVLWAENSQITGDTMYVQLKNKKLDAAQVVGNGFIINTQADSARFNQIKAKVITAFFKQGNVDNVYADGNAESIYFNRDDKTRQFTEMSQTVGSRLRILFEDRKIRRLYNITKTEGVIYPSDKIPATAELPGFNWQPALRPRSKYQAITKTRRSAASAVKPSPSKAKAKQ